ncbi:MAG: oligosaccharide flippase family protein, partial [FCB group bacterium]|nr:oligosaccharide flippase family protein [FCB group bacterium]
MFDRIKALSQQTLLYGAGHILARMVTFLLLPLYTNAFTPAEYGVVSLAYTFMGFMSVVLHYGLDAALMKYYVPADPPERKRLLTTAYLSFIITSAGFALFLFLVRGVASDLLLGGHYPRYLAYIAAILALDILWSVPMLLLRSEGRPLSFIGFSLLNVVSSLSLNLLLVIKYQMGVEGVLLSNLLTSGGLVLITAPLVVKRTRGGAVSWMTWKRLMRFGLPFLPSGIFAMLMELADRYILKAMTNMETVGLYSAGYKLGMLMMLLVMGFNMGWQPFFLKEGDGEEKRQMYSRITTYVLTVLGFFWVLLLLWVDALVKLRIGPVTVYGPEYWSSTQIVPLIALGYVFFAAYSLQLPGVFLREKSKYAALTRGFGAALNIGANLLLIPYFGALGAAAATCLSFFLMAVMIYVINQDL